MPYRFLAELVVLVHVSFVLFAVAGGMLALRWRRCAYVHIPAAAWAVLIEMMGWVCPLTPFEIWLREKAGVKGYATGFIEHYMLQVLYPAQLTRLFQITLGILVLALNLAIYSWVVRRLVRQKT